MHFSSSCNNILLASSLKVRREGGAVEKKKKEKKKTCTCLCVCGSIQLKILLNYAHPIGGLLLNEVSQIGVFQHLSRIRTM